MPTRTSGALLLGFVLTLSPCALWAQGDDAEAPRQPHPALMAPLAIHNIVNDLEPAGERLVGVGAHGAIVLVAEDGRWEQAPSPVDVMLNRVRFVDELRGWAVGHDGAILHTQDGGESWTLQRWEPDGNTLFDVRFFDADNGIAVGGYGTMLTTTDGGATWEPRMPEISDIVGQHYYELIALGDGSLFIAGERGLLARSADRGATWALIDSPYTGSFFGASAFGERGVLVYGLRGNMFVTDDASALPVMEAMDWDIYSRESVTDPEALAELGWRFIQTPVTETLFGDTRLGDDVLIVGVNGVVFRVDPESAQARRLPLPELDTLADIAVRADGWFVAGRRGVQFLTAEQTRGDTSEQPSEPGAQP